ncbi:hypothetical protein ACEPAF_2661 [Sanghuangporus sanghuang]
MERRREQDQSQGKISYKIDRKRLELKRETRNDGQSTERGKTRRDTDFSVDHHVDQYLFHDDGDDDDDDDDRGSAEQSHLVVFGMSQPPPLSGNLVVGPLLVSNTLSWALWGVLSTQLAFFLRDIRATRPTAGSPPPSTTRSTRRTSRLFGPGHGYEEFEKQQHSHSHNTGFGFWFRGRRKKSHNESKSTFADAIDDDINPWRKSFVPPPTPPPLASISAFPSPSHIHNHTRQRSGKSVPSSSDPYSPTAVHPSPLDTDSHSIFPSSAVPLELPSVYLFLLLYALYVFTCVRTILGTVQFWRVAVHLWGIGPSDLGPQWVGIVLADVIGPLIFAMTAAYFIYALYFSPSSYESATRRGSALRPLSLLKNKTSANVLPEPYSFPFPQSPSSSVARSNPNQTPHRHSRHQHHHQQTQTRPWQRWFLFLQTKPSSTMTMASRYAIIEPALLALLTLVVTICGLINCARSFKERPLGEPMKLDAVSLIWLAGMFALDLVLCILLCRALGMRLTTGPWISRLLRVMGEAGGAQLVVALLALVLMVSWRGGKPRSTLTIVAPSILPAVYAITVFLHASSSHRRRSRSDHRHLTSSLSASRVPSKSGVGSKFEDIEMGLRSASRGVISPVPPTRVDLAAAAAGSTYSTTNSSVDGGAALRAQALAYGREREREREKEKEREKERELMAEKEAAALGAGVRLHIERDTHGESSNYTSTTSNNNNANTSPAISVPGVGVGVPRSTGIAETVTSNAKAPSVRSGVSGALSLELPTFRKGKSLRAWRYGYSGYGYGDPMMDDESGSDLGSDEDEWDEELDVDSEELGGALGGMGGGNGGTWDYGFAKEEREREREKAATLLAAGGGSLNPNTNAGSVNGNGNGNEGTRLSVLGRNAGPSRRWLGSTLPPGKHSSFPSRPSSWRRSHPHPLSQSTNADANADETNEDDDKLSMLSGTSTTRSRRRGRRSYYASHNFGYGPAYPQAPSGNNIKGKRAPRLLPRTPGTLPFLPPLPPYPNAPASLASLSTDSLYLSNAPPPSTPGRGAPCTPASSVLVIARTSPLEPSIAEESIDRAASVAATRASTGSMFSTFSYTYPHPHHHPHHHPYEYAQYYGNGGYGHAGAYYPRPVQLPDLDVDLAGGGGGDDAAGEGGGGGAGESGSRGGDEEKEKAEEEARALGSLSPGGASPGDNTSGVGSVSGSGGRTETRSPHPYSYSLTGDGANGRGADEEEEAEQPAARRRWNVHPLKRIAEMGRLRF